MVEINSPFTLYTHNFTCTARGKSNLIVVTRIIHTGKMATIALASVHGIAGMLLAFLRMDKPLLSQERIYSMMPLLLLVTTAMFVIGMASD